MLGAIRRELEECEGMYFLPDDLEALMEIIAKGLANAGVGPEWLRTKPKVEYNLDGQWRESDGLTDEISGM